MIEIDPTARVSPMADIEESVRGTLIQIGPRAVVDSFVKIKPVGGSGAVRVGEASYLNSGTVIYSGNGVTLGRGVLVAANCTFAATNHQFARADTPIASQGFQPSRGGIVVEDDVWIGANCVILDGAHIGKGAVIGAGSVVRGQVEPYKIFAGNPLREIGARR